MSETVVIPEDFRKLVELSFSRILDRVEGVSKEMNAKVDGLSQAVERGNQEFRRIVDDHESRLREQAKIDSKQGEDIANLRVEFERGLGEMRADAANMRGEIINLRSALVAIKTHQEKQSEQQLGFWQKIAIEGVKFAVFGGMAGGVVVAALRMTGVL